MSWFLDALGCDLYDNKYVDSHILQSFIASINIQPNGQRWNNFSCPGETWTERAVVQLIVQWISRVTLISYLHTFSANIYNYLCGWRLGIWDWSLTGAAECWVRTRFLLTKTVTRARLDSALRVWDRGQSTGASCFVIYMMLKKYAFFIRNFSCTLKIGSKSKWVNNSVSLYHHLSIWCSFWATILPGIF